jgi:CRISPR/Cas system-associated exonuclease Cas4 (RecB family)
MCTTLLIIILTGVLYVYKSNPLIIDGLTEYNNSREKIILEIVNKGYRGIELQEVTLLSNIKPEHVELGISYTMQLVAGGIDEAVQANQIKFVNIDEQVIEPELSNQNKKIAIESKGNIPIHYGIRISNKVSISDVIIKYKYYGITKTKHVNLNNWTGNYLD